MRNCKLISAILAVIMLFCAVPAAMLAEGMNDVVSETAAMTKLDNAWAALERAEAEAIANGASKQEVIASVHNAALNLDMVDSDSFSDFTKDGFFFTVDGMLNSYNYRLRNEVKSNVYCEGSASVIDMSSGREAAPLKDATSPDVLLIGPYYGGYDPTFTDQYLEEATSVAEATSGILTVLEGHGATGPAIIDAFTNKGAIFFDSHGIATSGSSYLCLTTNEGITQEDYSNGWAVRSGGAAFIDGRYVENHIAAPASNSIVWMAICEGMKKSGRGITGTALLNAGCEVVYGYSQSVTFSGDYLYEATFWNVMKEEGSVNEAFALMVETHGDHDKYGDAYPIVMSAVDPFPENPDAPQHVNVEYTLFGNPPPVAITDFNLSEESVEIDVGKEATVNFLREPANASLYEAVWTSSNENIVSFTKTNNRKVVVYGMSAGTATITCTVMVDGQVFGEKSFEVTVNGNEELSAALNVEGGHLYFGVSDQHPFEAYVDGDRNCARSTNYHKPNRSSDLTLSLNMKAGDTLGFDYMVSSQEDHDLFTFSVNGEVVLTDSGLEKPWTNYVFTAPADGTYFFVWSFTKDGSQSSGLDRVFVDNVEFSGDVSAIEPDGDVDGDGETKVADAVLIMRAALGLVEFTLEQVLHGDVDCDGVIKVADAVNVMRMALGLQ